MLPCSVHRLIVAEYRVDFRKYFDGLLSEAYRLGYDPYLGDCVVFAKVDRTQIRVLLGDAKGLYLLLRRFEGGRIKWMWQVLDRPHGATITIAELSLLLEGASFTVHKRVKNWK